MSAHFCNPFHHFIFNLLSLMAVECSCCYSLLHTTVKSFQEGQSNLCLTLWFGCLSAALSALQGHSSAPLTGESFAEKVSLAHQPDRDRAFTFFFHLPWEAGSWTWTLMVSPGGSTRGIFVTQFPPRLVAPLRTEKQFFIYILSSIKYQFFHKLHTPSDLTSDTSPKWECGHNLASSFQYNISVAAESSAFRQKPLQSELNLCAGQYVAVREKSLHRIEKGTPRQKYISTLCI